MSLGFDKGFEGIVNKIEKGMNMENIFRGFILYVIIDQSSETISFTFVSWVLNLFGPDMIQKPWNSNSDFELFMKRKGKPVYLFHLKDERFACLPRCAAIVIYHWNGFLNFLDQHDYITNKLACLVRDAMEMEYILVVLTAVAAFGIHLVSPYFVKKVW